MNQSQRMKYFTELWPAAMAAQGWERLNTAQREEKRRAATLKATGSDSTKGLSQWQITKLFNYLKFLADDSNLNRAMPVANPDLARQDDARRRLVYAIQDCGFTVMYVQRVADGYCRQERVDDWRKLPVPVLQRLVITIKERAFTRAGGVRVKRQKPATPSQQFATSEYADRDPLPPAVAALILNHGESDNPF